MAHIRFRNYCWLHWSISWSRNDGLHKQMGPLLIWGGVVGRCCRVAEWPASVGWLFLDIGNWFPDIGKSSTFPDIGKSIPDIRKSFPDIGKLIISRYRKLISRYREMLNKNPNGFPYTRALGANQRRTAQHTNMAQDEADLNFATTTN